MAWFVWSGVYVLGALVALRLAILRRATMIQRHADQCFDRRCEEHHTLRGLRSDEDHFFAILGSAVGWPFLVIVFCVRMVTFPRGVRTKYSIARDRRIKAEEQERLIAKAARELGLPTAVDVEMRAIESGMVRLKEDRNRLLQDRERILR